MRTGTRIAIAALLSFSACKRAEEPKTETNGQPLPPPLDAREPPQSPPEVREAWKRIASSENGCPEVFDYFPDGGMRILWCHAETLLPFAKLGALAGTNVFLSGPHGQDRLKLDSETSFGRYNPKFVDWLVANALPAAADPAFREATQAVYDRILRERAHMYWHAYHRLDKNPEFLEREKQAYLDYMKEPAGKRPLERYATLAPEGWPNEYPPAVAFWVRRHLDGTAKQFQRGLERLLALYDAKYIAELDGQDFSVPGDPPKGPGAATQKLPFSSETLEGAVKNIWAKLGAFPPESACSDQFAYDPGGLRVHFCRASSMLTFAALQNKLDFPIFLKGPHSKTVLDLDNDRDFGHYNPQFVKWLTDRALPAAADPSIRALTQPTYDRHARIPARMFFYAKRMLDADPKGKKETLDAYRKWMEDPDADTSPRYQYWTMIPELSVWEAQAIGGSAIGFWLRRSIDGTDALFADGLKKLLRTYDARWLTEAESTPPPKAGKKLESWFPAPPGYGQPGETKTL